MTYFTKPLSIVCLILAICACEASYGDKYTIDNFELYYGENVNPVYVQKTAEYFRDNGLIQEQKHSAQLNYQEESSTFVLKMILNNRHKKLPIKMVDDLLLLEEDIRNSVFDDLNFEIQVCDEEFKPIDAK